MSPNSPAIFLDHILRKHNSSRHIRVSRGTLDAFCQNNQQVFFTICQELFDLILQTLQRTPAPDIHPGVLETIAVDLSAIVRPLWIVHQGILQSYVVQARDLARSASKMKEGTGRNRCIQNCCQELEKAYAFLGGI
jgi:hypothetical protein